MFTNLLNFTISFRDEIKKKNDKIIVLSTESSVYQIETNKAKKIVEGLNEELNLVMCNFISFYLHMI